MNAKEEKSVDELTSLCRECIPVVQANVNRLSKCYPDGHILSLLDKSLDLIARLKKATSQ